MFDPEAPGAPSAAVLTDEQRATLAASLGAVEIPQTAPEAGYDGDAAGNERVPAQA
jgi:hypothetical protein